MSWNILVEAFFFSGTTTFEWMCFIRLLGRICDDDGDNDDEMCAVVSVWNACTGTVRSSYGIQQLIRVRANAIVKPTRYLDRSLFDWNQNRTHCRCCCCCRCFFFIFFFYFYCILQQQELQRQMLSNCRNIFRRTFAQYYTHGNVNVFWQFFFLYLADFPFFYFNRPCLNTRFDAIRRFCSKFSITRISYLFLSLTCVTNGIRCLTVACSSQSMACQSMHTFFLSLSFVRSRA